MKKISFTLISLLLLLTDCSKKKSNETEFSYEANKIRSSYIAIIESLESRAYSKVVEIRQNALGSYGSYGVNEFNKLRKNYGELLVIHENLSIVKNIFNDPNQNPWKNYDELLNCSIIYPNYMDYILSDANSGIVNDPINYPTVNDYTVRSWHEKTNPKRRLLGMHAIEFMVWGEDNSVTTSGQRTYGDYYPNQNGLRRVNLLRGQCNSLQIDYESILGNQEFKKLLATYDPKQLLSVFIDAITMTLEKDIAEKTLLKPVTSANPIDELYPFSDLSGKALLAQIKGVGYFMDGRNYFAKKEIEYYLIDLIKDIDPSQGEAIEQLYVKLVTDATNVSTTSFDTLLNNESGKSSLLSIYRTALDLSEALKKFKSEYIRQK